MDIEIHEGDLVTFGNSDGTEGLTFVAPWGARHRVNVVYGKLISITRAEVVLAERILHGLFKWGSLAFAVIWLYSLVWSLL